MHKLFNSNEIQFYLLFSFVACAFTVILPNPVLCRFTCMFSSNSFKVLTLRIRALIHLNFSMWYELHFFFMWISRAPFIEETIFSSLNGLGTLEEHEVATDVWVYF